MLIVGYCFGIRSERRLCEEVHLNLAYRWFCRLGLDADVPDHSTFSKNRHGRFRESDLLRKLFETVVARCMKEGIVGGEAFAVDASIIVADAHRRRGVGKVEDLDPTSSRASPNIFRFSMTRPSAGRRRSSRRRSRRPIERPATQPRPTSASPCMPRRMSVWPVAIQTRHPEGMGITIAAPSGSPKSEPRTRQRRSELAPPSPRQRSGRARNSAPP